MAISSPLDLSPLVWVNPNAGTYSGSTLTALSNPGSAGGNFSLQGTIVKGASIGAFTTLDLSGEWLDLAQPALNTGVFTLVVWGKLSVAGSGVGGGGGCSVFGVGWPGHITSAKAGYLNYNNGGANSLAFGNACCSVDASHAPSFETNDGGVNHTNFFTALFQLGATNAQYRDNVLQTNINANANGTVPNFTANTWSYGAADSASSEFFNGAAAGYLLFDKVLSSTERGDLEAWIQSQASGAISGSASIAMPKPAITAAGVVSVKGVLSKAMPGPSLSASGAVAVQGSLSKTLPAPSLSAAGTVAVQGAASITMPPPGLSADGVVDAVPIEGAADITMPAPLLVATGRVTTPAASIGGASPAVLRRALREHENDQVIARQMAALKAQQEDDDEAALMLLLAA